MVQWSSWHHTVRRVRLPGLTAVKMVPPWRTINAVELAQGRVESIQATTEKLTAEQGREIRLRAAK